ncbi:hypothetical protein EJB05_16799, partial [Eragrostis curvula]
LLIPRETTLVRDCAVEPASGTKARQVAGRPRGERSLVVVIVLLLGSSICRYWTCHGYTIDEELKPEEALSTAKEPGWKSRAWSSTVSFSDVDEKNETDVEGGDDFTGLRKNKGREFRGVHRAIICGKVGQTPVQKILRNGHTVTVFTVGTGGMWDQRIEGADLPMPAQWHRIAVHNDQLGAFAVQKLVKNTSVYVEGDIETRVYNDNVNDQVKNIPEICVRRDGKINLMQSGETNVSQSLDELREGLF